MKKTKFLGTSDAAVAAQQTRGYRNRNPFNIRKTNSKWAGKVLHGQDPAFEQFDLMVWGVRAGLYLLTKYVRDYRLRTVKQIIHRWAPDGDGTNNEKAYYDAMRKGATFTNDVQQNKGWLYAVAAGMCRVESRYYLPAAGFESAFALLPYPMKCFWCGLSPEGQEREEVDGL